MESVTVAWRTRYHARKYSSSVLRLLPTVHSVHPTPDLSSVRRRTEAFVRGEYCLPQVGIQKDSWDGEYHTLARGRWADWLGSKRDYAHARRPCAQPRCRDCWRGSCRMAREPVGRCLD